MQLLLYSELATLVCSFGQSLSASIKIIERCNLGLIIGIYTLNIICHTIYLFIIQLLPRTDSGRMDHLWTPILLIQGPRRARTQLVRLVPAPH